MDVGSPSTAPPSATGSARAASRAANPGVAAVGRIAAPVKAADQQPQGRLSDRVDEKTTVMNRRAAKFSSGRQKGEQNNGRGAENSAHSGREAWTVACKRPPRRHRNGLREGVLHWMNRHPSPMKPRRYARSSESRSSARRRWSS